MHPFNVYWHPLHTAPETPASPDGVTLREASVADVKELRKGRLDLPEYFYRDEAEDLERCWVGLWDGQLVFIAWVSLRGSSKMVRLGPGQAELAFVHNLESMRGRGVTKHAVHLIARTLLAEGYTGLMAVPHAENAAVNRAFVASGFVKIGTIRRYGIFTRPRTPVDPSTWIAGASAGGAAPLRVTT
ncbi:MAG TPA: GNAT family N-acetyltransferase [Gemmatimonadaceae bacterium]|nr:GNAT family N-acetyltransferase [Gemmatimonadaceae bacterium]